MSGLTRSPLARLAAAVQTRTANDDGMTTAEYAVGTVAACGFAGVLYKVVTSPPILDLIKSVFSRALHLSF